MIEGELVDDVPATTAASPRHASAGDADTSADVDGTAAGLAVTREIDATGLSCPMPVIELARTIEQIAVGERVALIATDPAARVDVPVWCRMQRQRLLLTEESTAAWRFVVERRR